MKKTALQEAFNLLEELHPSFFDVHTEKGRTFINTFHKFLKLEKEQIEQAYIDGAIDDERCVYGFKSLNEYYNLTFKSE